MRRLTFTVRIVLITTIMLLFLTGCARFWDRVESKGGFFGSYTGSYIIINHSGGNIMDVWKLKNVIVQSSDRSDGWLFKDSLGNMVNLGGDVKIIRVIKNSLWDSYHEYHSEFESKSYAEKFLE